MKTGLGLLNGPGHPQRLRGAAVTQRVGQRIRTDDSGGDGAAGGRREQVSEPRGVEMSLSLMDTILLKHTRGCTVQSIL